MGSSSLKMTDLFEFFHRISYYFKIMNFMKYNLTCFGVFFPLDKLVSIKNTQSNFNYYEALHGNF